MTSIPIRANGWIAMNFIEQLSAVTLLIAFLFGAALGIVGGTVHGSLCEDRKKTLLLAAPDLLSGSARMIFGLYARDDAR
jgi:hypothetical protein